MLRFGGKFAKVGTKATTLRYFNSLRTNGAIRSLKPISAQPKRKEVILVLRRFASGRASGKSSTHQSAQQKNVRMAYTISAVAVLVFGLSYASVPLYKAFCQLTGFGGTTQVATEEKSKKVMPVEGGRIIKVYFTANAHDAMPWKFRPTQNEVHVIPGETALAFYTVKNTADHPVTGVATYNVYPPKAGLYFCKIQCFCFEEQRLDAFEEIDMPVFFFIDPEFVDDPAMDSVNHITLSYTFFKTDEEAAAAVSAGAMSGRDESKKIPLSNSVSVVSK